MVGLGELCFGARAVEAYLHESVAEVLLASPDVAPERIAALLRPYVGYQGAGAETRGNAAVDLALWDRRTATRICDALAPYQPYWVEDPLRGASTDAYDRLHHDVEVTIVAGETCVGRRGFAPLLTRGAIDIATVDVQWTGGVTE